MQIHKSKFIVGELEDDDDEHQRELERKIKLSNQRLREVEGKLEESNCTVDQLRKLQRTQAEELEELRRLIRELNREPKPVIQQPVPEPVRAPVDSGGRPEPKKNVGKWSQFALAGKSMEPAVQQIPSREIIEEEEEEIVPVVVKEKVLIPRKKPKPKAAEPKSPPLKPQVRTVTVVFPEDRMTQLAGVAGVWGEEVSVTVLENISPDDLIFEIRRVVAEKVRP